MYSNEVEIQSLRVPPLRGACWWGAWFTCTASALLSRQDPPPRHGLPIPDQLCVWALPWASPAALRGTQRCLDKPQAALADTFPGMQETHPVFGEERAFGSRIPTFCLHRSPSPNGDRATESLGIEKMSRASQSGGAGGGKVAKDTCWQGLL